MVEERFVPCAQIVQPRLAVGGQNETVLWAFAIACKTYVALTALAWKQVIFVISEFALLV
jgi:hypothetical protein